MYSEWPLESHACLQLVVVVGGGGGIRNSFTKKL